MGQQPTTSDSIMVGYAGTSPAAFNFSKEWQCQREIARTFLTRAAKKMKKWADQGRKPANFQVGDLVLVKLQPTHLKFFRRVHKGLVHKYEGLFPVVERVGAVGYKLQLSRWFRVHPVFHASLLKPFHADRQDLSRGLSTRPPPNVIATEKQVDAVLAERV